MTTSQRSAASDRVALNLLETWAGVFNLEHFEGDLILPQFELIEGLGCWSAFSVRNGSPVVSIDRRLFGDDGNEVYAAGCLLHQLAHAWQWQQGHKVIHGPRFLRSCQRMGLGRVTARKCRRWPMVTDSREFLRARDLLTESEGQICGAMPRKEVSE